LLSGKLPLIGINARIVEIKRLAILRMGNQARTVRRIIGSEAMLASAKSGVGSIGRGYGHVICPYGC
jgi:hypothetical protein